VNLYYIYQNNDLGVHAEPIHRDGESIMVVIRCQWFHMYPFYQVGFVRLKSTIYFQLETMKYIYTLTIVDDKRSKFCYQGKQKPLK
jgi:hypothetical protein